MTQKLTALLAVLWLTTVVLLAIFGPFTTPASPFQPVAPPLASPSAHAPLGSDSLGRDLYARLVYGARRSLVAASTATALTVFIGTSLGLLSILYPAWLDAVILMFSNAALAIPGLLLAMLFVAALGPGYDTVILAIGLGGAPGFLRLSRSVFAQLIEEEYVDAARAVGAGKLHLAWRHLLPNAQGQLLSLSTTHFAWAFMGITTLTFLGLAGDPSIPEWGVMMNSGRVHLIGTPRLAILPGVLISLTIISVHHLGTEFSQRSQPR